MKATLTDLVGVSDGLVATMSMQASGQEVLALELRGLAPVLDAPEVSDPEQAEPAYTGQVCTVVAGGNCHN